MFLFYAPENIENPEFFFFFQELWKENFELKWDETMNLLVFEDHHFVVFTVEY